MYFDHAATTPLDEKVLQKMLPYLTENFGNANSVHTIGRKSMEAVDFARDNIAKIIGANSNEIYFTSGGTESDNWAINIAVNSNKDKKHIVSTPIEHPAVLSALKRLEDKGYVIDFLSVNKNGEISLDELKTKVTSSTVLVIMMTANNETGVILPIKKASKIAKDAGALFFTDAVQAIGQMKINVLDTGVSMMSFSSHKFYGPKGVGVLYVKNGIKITPLISGGFQEREKRGGTTNVAGVYGMGEALLIASNNYDENAKKVGSLRDEFENILTKNLSNIKINKSENRLPSVSSVTFLGVNGEALLYNLDQNGIYASNGSACSAGSVRPSSVLTAIGLSEKDAKSTVRFSFGKNNSMEEILTATKIIIETVNKMLNK